MTTEELFLKGLEYYHQNNFVEAVKCFRQGAEEGDPTCQYNLGVAYNSGKGVIQDYEQAKVWLLKATENDFAPAYTLLGHMREKGLGMDVNEEDALWFYRVASSKGDAIGLYSAGVMFLEGRGTDKNYNMAFQHFLYSAKNRDTPAGTYFYLGLCYEKGYGTDVNMALAIQNYEQSARMGDAAAKRNLGLCYLLGKGVKQDSIKALYWTEQAAKGGDRLAFRHLGLMYMRGEGVPKDKNKALLYLNEAAKRGDKYAQQVFDELSTSGWGATLVKKLTEKMIEKLFDL